MGGAITSDAGVLLLAQAERRLGIVDRLAALIPDGRDPSRVLHSLSDILRARVLAIAAGYGEYPKAWGNCVLVVRLAGFMDALCPRNLPGKA